jgi:hypothetical protein
MSDHWVRGYGPDVLLPLFHEADVTAVMTAAIRSASTLADLYGLLGDGEGRDAA